MRTPSWGFRAIAPDLVFAGPYHSPNLLHNAIAAICRRRRIPYCNLPASAYVGERNAVLGRFLNRGLGMQSSIIDVDYDRLNRLIGEHQPGIAAVASSSYFLDRLTSKATDYTGKGVKAEVSLALVDKAVLALADDPNPTLKQAFYEKRPLGVFTAQSP